MAIPTLIQHEPDARPPTAPRPAAAGRTPTAPVILALDLGQRTGWAVRNRDGAIASGVHEFRPGRFEGGGMIWLRFRAWLQEIDETAGGVGVVVFEEVQAASRHRCGARLRRLPRAPHRLGRGEQDPVPGRAGGHDQAAHRRQGQRRQGGGDRRRPQARLRPADDNEADALALLDWAIAQGIGGAR